MGSNEYFVATGDRKRPQSDEVIHGVILAEKKAHPSGRAKAKELGLSEKSLKLLYDDPA